MRFVGASTENGGLTHHGTTRRENGVNSSGYWTGCRRKLIYYQGQSTPFGRWQKESFCMLGERNSDCIQRDGGGN